MGDTGLEQPAMLAQEGGFSAQPCTKSGAPGGCTWRHMAPVSAETDRDLAAVVHAWPNLGPHVKLAILALATTVG